MSLFLSGGGGGVATITPGTYTGIVLVDSSSTLWFVTVLTTGNLKTAVTGSVPSGAYYPGSVVLKDPNSVIWTITITTSGDLISTPGGTLPLASINLTDANGRTWAVTVNTSGNLITT